MSIYNFDPSPSSPVIPGDYTVDTLPDPSLYIDKYARVTDLFGGKRDLVLASSYKGLNFWQPVRQQFGESVPITGDFTVFPLKNPSIIVGTGSIGLGVTRNITLSPVGGWPGATFQIKAGLTTLSGALNILGTGLGSGVSMLLGNTKTFVLDYSTGSLAWVQLE